MAIQTDSNPLRYDTTTGASWTGVKFVRLIQWVDLNEDIVDSDELVMTINGVTVQCEVQVAADSLPGGAVIWNIGPFNPGIAIKNFAVTTLDSGVVYVWV